MTLQFGSGSGTPVFSTAPASGSPTLQVGTGLFSGGAAPNFQGTSAIGVNMAAGYANNLLDLQIAGVSQLSVAGKNLLIGSNQVLTDDGTITTLGRVSTFQSLPGLVRVGAYIGTNNQAMSVLPSSAGTRVLVAHGIAAQTADLFVAEDSASANQFGIANIGTGVSPIWALRVAPTANAASMAQAHVGGASTGKAIQVIDNAGTSLGWLQLLA